MQCVDDPSKVQQHRYRDTPSETLRAALHASGATKLGRLTVLGRREDRLASTLLQKFQRELKLLSCVEVAAEVLYNLHVRPVHRYTSDLTCNVRGA